MMSFKIRLRSDEKKRIGEEAQNRWLFPEEGRHVALALDKSKDRGDRSCPSSRGNQGASGEEDPEKSGRRIGDRTEHQCVLDAVPLPHSCILSNPRQGVANPDASRCHWGRCAVHTLHN